MLSQNELIQLLPPDPALVDAPLRAFEALLPTEFRAPGFLKRAITEGWTIPVQVTLADGPAFLLAYHRTWDSGLWIDCAKALRPHAPSLALWQGLETLAKLGGAPYVRFATPRRGLVRYAQEVGFKVESVMLGKGIA